MSIPITTVGEVTQQQGVKILVYGQSGFGKTYAIGTLPHPIIFSTERGLLSLAAQWPHLHTSAITDYSTFYNAMQWAASAESQQYSHVVLDSFTDIAEIVLTAEKGKTKDGRKAYGETQDIVLQFSRMIRDLPRDVYITAQEGQIVDADGLAKFGPVFPGKNLAQKVPFFFDEVFQLIVKAEADGSRHRWLRTAGDMQFVAKVRSGRLGPWEYCDLNAVFTKIRGGA